MRSWTPRLMSTAQVSVNFHARNWHATLLTSYVSQIYPPPPTAFFDSLPSPIHVVSMAVKAICKCGGRGSGFDPNPHSKSLPTWENLISSSAYHSFCKVLAILRPHPGPGNTWWARWLAGRSSYCNVEYKAINYTLEYFIKLGNITFRLPTFRRNLLSFYSRYAEMSVHITKAHSVITQNTAILMFTSTKI
jgi:hypothetical protein